MDGEYNPKKEEEGDEWTTHNGEGWRTNSEEESQQPEKTDYKQCLQPTADKS